MRQHAVNEQARPREIINGIGFVQEPRAVIHMDMSEGVSGGSEFFH